MVSAKIQVPGNEIAAKTEHEEDYICLTDIAGIPTYGFDGMI